MHAKNQRLPVNANKVAALVLMVDAAVIRFRLRQRAQQPLEIVLKDF